MKEIIEVFWNTFVFFSKLTFTKVTTFLAANCWIILSFAFFATFAYETASYFCPSTLTKSITKVINYVSNKVGDDIQKEAVLLEKLKKVVLTQSDGVIDIVPNYLLFPSNMATWRDLIHYFETTDIKALTNRSLSNFKNDLGITLYYPLGTNTTEWQAYLFTIDNALAHVGQHFRVIKGLLLGSDCSHPCFSFIKDFKYSNDETLLDTIKRLHEYRNYILEATTDEERLQRYLEIKNTDYRIRNSHLLGNRLGFFFMLVVFECLGYFFFTSDFFEFT